MTNHLIIGAGEVGTAVYKLLDGIEGVNVLIRDIEPIFIPWDDIDFLHIAFPDPGGGRFLPLMNEYDKEYDPKIIVVHSTVTPGTIRSMGPRYVHIPTHGRHPDIAEYMKRIKMYIGGMDNENIEKVSQIFTKAGCDVRPLYDLPPETSEITKVMCTTYLGWNVVFEKFMWDLCEYYKVPFDVVYTEWNKHYNKGVVDPERHNRPVLNHVEGGISGHCVMENCTIMHQDCPEEMKWLFETIMNIGKRNDNKSINKAYLYIEFIIKNRTIDDLANELNTEPHIIEEVLEEMDIPMWEDQ